jgi:hypothetical protein
MKTNTINVRVNRTAANYDGTGSYVCSVALREIIIYDREQCEAFKAAYECSKKGGKIDSYRARYTIEKVEDSFRVGGWIVTAAELDELIAVAEKNLPKVRVNSVTGELY